MNQRKKRLLFAYHLTVQPIPDTMEAGRNYFLPD